MILKPLWNLSSSYVLYIYIFFRIPTIVALLVLRNNKRLQKMYSPSGHLRCRCYNSLFIGTGLEKFSITLAHQWILYSEWVPSE